MGTRSDWDEWHIASDREGFFIEDAYGDDLSPTRRFQSFATAEGYLEEMVQQAIDNYDGPPDGEAWSGGFADNH